MTPRLEPPMEEDEEDDNNRYWHISRGVPIAPMMAMLGYVATQVAIAAWFASAMNARVDAGERAQAQLQVQVAPLGDRMTRVEEKLIAVQSGITDIKTSLQGKPQR